MEKQQCNIAMFEAMITYNQRHWYDFTSPQCLKTMYSGLTFILEGFKTIFYHGIWMAFTFVHPSQLWSFEEKLVADDFVDF